MLLWYFSLIQSSRPTNWQTDIDIDATMPLARLWLKIWSPIEIILSASSDLFKVKWLLTSEYLWFNTVAVSKAIICLFVGWIKLYCRSDITGIYLFFCICKVDTHTHNANISPMHQFSNLFLCFTTIATYQRFQFPSALRTSAWLWWPWSEPPWSEVDQSLGQGAAGSQTYSASPGGKQ